MLDFGGRFACRRALIFLIPRAHEKRQLRRAPEGRVQAAFLLIRENYLWNVLCRCVVEPSYFLLVLRLVAKKQVSSPCKNQGL